MCMCSHIHVHTDIYITCCTYLYITTTRFCHVHMITKVNHVLFIVPYLAGKVCSGGTNTVPVKVVVMGLVQMKRLDSAIENSVKVYKVKKFY